MNISSGENVFSSSGSSGFEDATTRKLTDTRIAVHVLHALNKDTIRFLSETNLSSKWKMFLENTTNKEELFSLLTKKVRDF